MENELLLVYPTNAFILELGLTLSNAGLDLRLFQLYRLSDRNEIIFAAVHCLRAWGINFHHLPLAFTKRFIAMVRMLFVV